MIKFRNEEASLPDSHGARDVERAAERLRWLAKGVSAVTWATSPTGAMSAPNPGFEAFTGLKPEQYLGWRWLGAIHPEDAQSLFDAVQSDVTAQKTAKAWYRMRRHDGKYREMEALVTPVIEAGVVIEWTGISVDVTERNEAERLLRLGRRRLLFLERLARRTSLCGTGETIAITTRSVAQFLGADGCAHAEVDASGGRFRLGEGQHRIQASCIGVECDLSVLGPSAEGLLQQGQCVAIRDTLSGPDEAPEAARLFRVRSLLCAPLRYGNVTTGLLIATQSLPRNWSGQEIVALRQVALRLASRVARLGAVR